MPERRLNGTLRVNLRTSLDEVCTAMRAYKDSLDRTAADFQRCSDQSRETIRTSYVLLTRIEGAMLKQAPQR